jgi:hypothetical protein
MLENQRFANHTTLNLCVILIRPASSLISSEETRENTLQESLGDQKFCIRRRMLIEKIKTIILENRK